MSKKVFDLNDYKNGKYAMHLKTPQEIRQFSEGLDAKDMRWRSGDKYTRLHYWDRYKEETCYNFNEGTIGSLDHFIEEGYTILEFSDYREWV